MKRDLHWAADGSVETSYRSVPHGESAEADWLDNIAKVCSTLKKSKRHQEYWGVLGLFFIVLGA